MTVVEECFNLSVKVLWHFRGNLLNPEPIALRAWEKQGYLDDPCQADLEVIMLMSEVLSEQ